MTFFHVHTKVTQSYLHSLYQRYPDHCLKYSFVWVAYVWTFDTVPKKHPMTPRGLLQQVTSKKINLEPFLHMVDINAQASGCRIEGAGVSFQVIGCSGWTIFYNYLSRRKSRLEKPGRTERFQSWVCKPSAKAIHPRTDQRPTPQTSTGRNPVHWQDLEVLEKRLVATENS